MHLALQALSYLQAIFIIRQHGKSNCTRKRCQFDDKIFLRSSNPNGQPFGAGSFQARCRFCPQPFVSEYFACILILVLAKRSKPQYPQWIVRSFPMTILIQVYSLPLSGCEFAVVIVAARQGGLELGSCFLPCKSSQTDTSSWFMSAFFETSSISLTPGSWFHVCLGQLRSRFMLMCCWWNFGIAKFKTVLTFEMPMCLHCSSGFWWMSTLPPITALSEAQQLIPDGTKINEHGDLVVLTKTPWP